MGEAAVELTAIVVTRDRVDDVRACVQSALERPGAAVEVLVVLNGATPEVRAALEPLARDDDRLRLLAIEATSPSLARNRGAAAARGALLFFLDDDVLLPEGVIERACATMAAHPEVGIAGGPNLTPPDDPELAQLAGALLASRFGSGITRARYAPRHAGPARESDLVLCNLVVRRTLIEGGLAFPRLFGGEENVLMGRAADRGVKLYYDPGLAVHHRRRRTLAGHVEQVHRYGAGRANAILAAPNTFRLAYLAPVALLVYLLLLPAACLLAWVSERPSWALVAAAPLALYLSLAAASALGVALAARRPLWWPGLLMLYPITHLVYGAGLLRRLTRAMLERRLRPATRSTP